MQKQQVFKVKGMQRDASMANANGEFAYEILNMRLMPAEDLSGFSLTNEKGTLATGITLQGQVIGQCPTNDSLVVFTKQIQFSLEGDTSTDYIYEIWEGQGEDKTETDWDEIKWRSKILYQGNLNFNINYPIEALFNYETEDIQKVYWIDGINQLRCINLVGEIQEGNDQQFDSVKEINSLPLVEIERVVGGNFTAGVLQYYVTYFNEFSSESPIVYTSPLLYIAHDNRGANVNDQVSTAFKLTFTDLDTINWEYMRIYATHRTSIDATPEASIVIELNLNNSTIEFTDYGSNRTSIAPTDLYFTGGKFVKAGTMTVKDQVMFLGNLNIETPETVSIVEIQHLFDSIRDNEDHPFTTTTRKTKENKLEEYEDTHYYYKNQLNNTESITHYKYGEKYRFGISVLDKYGNWSNPIWIKDAFIEVPPEQVDKDTLELPCPSLNLSYSLMYDGETKTLLDHLQDRGVIDIKPIVVFPKEDERKVIAQGVVCSTVYNLKDRKENGPYAQASWFMRPNAPVDLWGFSADYLGIKDLVLVESSDKKALLTSTLSHKSDLYYFEKDSWDTKIGDLTAGYYGIGDISYKYSSGLSPFDYTHDDFSASVDSDPNSGELRPSDVVHTIYSYGKGQLPIQLDNAVTYNSSVIKSTVEKGAWLEFRHNYALRSPGWSFGAITPKKTWDKILSDNVDWGRARVSEIDTSDFNNTMPVNRVTGGDVEVGEETTGILSATNIRFATKMPYLEAYRTVINNGTIDIYIIHQESNTIRDTYKAAKGLWVQYPSEYGYDYGIFIQTEAGYSNSIYASEKNAKSLYINGDRYYEWFMLSDSQKSLFLTAEKDRLGNSFTYIPNILLSLSYGERSLENLNTGNSAYYVDNSIVTVNSPEIELSTSLHSISNIAGNFRIIGMIPLTATSSDISIEVEAPSENPKSLTTGLSKIKLTNTNIGFHGFKSLISSNAYHAYYTTEENFPYYGMVPLSPWHSTGSLGYYSNDDGNSGNKNLLKRKILSNLRFSASSYYFLPDSLSFEDDIEDKTKLNQHTIGWQPTNGCEIIPVADTGSPLYKFNQLSYPNCSNPIYKKDITSISLLSSGEFGSLPAETKIFSLGQSYAGGSYSSTENRLYDTATSAIKYNKTKNAKGASINYKSSPHFVVGFKPFTNMWSCNKTVQEVLPALRCLNEEGLLSNISEERIENLSYKSLHNDSSVSSLYHQEYLTISNFSNFGGLNTDPHYDNSVTSYRDTFLDTTVSLPNYGWLWLGEIYRETDPTFGGNSDYALQNNQWEAGGKNILNKFQLDDTHYYVAECSGGITYADGRTAYDREYWEIENDCGCITIVDRINGYRFEILDDKQLLKIVKFLNSDEQSKLSLTIKTFISDSDDAGSFYNGYYIIVKNILSDGKLEGFSIITDFPANGIGIKTIEVEDISVDILKARLYKAIEWDHGDTYYQRFDTLKTYAYSDSDQNSVVDITSFMVETRINIDGRTDRNRGQESNLQMSPTNFNLMNDVYSQRDNFFTYRILDEDLQSRTNFPNQITWSLTKTAGATVDAWMNITLASVLDLDGTKGELTALKNFNNNIIAFQEKGVSNVMFNSRAQIATSEAVPIQIANTGKVDGQQYFTTDVGCQDKWNIVTTPNGLYFVDYFNKSIYKFNGQLEDISTPNGFRSWCYENLNSTANILGYYDVKNKEVMYYIGNTGFMLDNSICPDWLGFSELTGAFSSFYTYPKAWFASIKDRGLWLLSDSRRGISVYAHQMGNYNSLLNSFNNQYGITVIPRQDSNTVKTFNNVEFRADSYNGSSLDNNKTFDTISAETEYQIRTTDTLTYSQYRPSNLKKKFRTWRANIPRVNHGYNRFVNQWAKIGLWKMDPSTEKTILHDLSVWYSE